MGIFGISDPSRGYTEGRDPPGKVRMKNFYKNHQIRSPGVYFTELHRFTKSLSSLNLKFLGVKSERFNAISPSPLNLIRSDIFGIYWGGFLSIK